MLQLATPSCGSDLVLLSAMGASWVSAWEGQANKLEDNAGSMGEDLIQILTACKCSHAAQT